MERQNNIIEVNNLCIKFKEKNGTENQAVHNVSFTLQKGKTLGIVGESGSGKSVSSLAIMGLLPSPPQCVVEGNITFCNADGDMCNLLTISENEMSNIRGNRIAMIFQDPMTSLNPVQKCGPQVAEMLQIHNHLSRKEARQKVLDLFDEVMLPRPESIYDSYPHQISGGQKQRVMIAMAMICKPDVLIADEPTTALDVTVQHAILQLLRKLQQQYSPAILFISHDLNVVANIADDIAVMYRGEIVETGTTSQIIRNPHHPYTQGLMACRPPETGHPLKLPTISDFMDSNGNGLSTTERPPFDDKKRLTPPLLSVKNLKVHYTTQRNLWGKVTKTYKAVDNISFDLWSGETLGLVGESGCGKTTLGRAITQLTNSTSDHITFCGRPMNTMSATELRQLRQQIQIIFQDPYSSLNPRLTIGQAIIEPLVSGKLMDSKQEARHRAEQLMQTVGLKTEWFSRYPHQLSGGQRQRACIARALITNPKLVICEESVSELDVSVQAQVLNLLNELKQQMQLSCLFISHDLSVVRFISDRIMVMQHGQMVEIGEADSLYNTPKKEYTKQLISTIPRYL